MDTSVKRAVMEGLAKIDEAITLAAREVAALREMREKAGQLGQRIEELAAPASPKAITVPFGVRVIDEQIMRSFSSPVNYNVRLFSDSMYDRCSCPDFTHRGTGRLGYTCKHIREARARYDLARYR